MNLLGTRRSRSQRPVDERPDTVPAAAPAGRRHAPIAATARSCCCPGEPVARAIIAPSADRPDESDILLCAHHLRRAAGALRASGAVVFDRTGEPLDDLTAVFAQDR